MVDDGAVGCMDEDGWKTICAPKEGLQRRCYTAASRHGGMLLEWVVRFAEGTRDCLRTRGQGELGGS